MGGQPDRLPNKRLEELASWEGALTSPPPMFSVAAMARELLSLRALYPAPRPGGEPVGDLAAACREVAGECLEKPRAALDDGVIKDDCLTELRSRSTSLCETCSLTDAIHALVQRVVERAVNTAAGHLCRPACDCAPCERTREIAYRIRQELGGA